MSDDAVRSGFVHHQCASLVHRYFALLEDPSRPVDQFAELFADEIAFDFTMVQISTFEQFADWADEFRNSFDRFTLTVLDIDIAAIASGTHTASIDLDFNAIGLDGDRKTMATTHTWTIANQKIQTITVAHR